MTQSLLEKVMPQLRAQLGGIFSEIQLQSIARDVDKSFQTRPIEVIVDADAAKAKTQLRGLTGKNVHFHIKAGDDRYAMAGTVSHYDEQRNVLVVGACGIMHLAYNPVSATRLSLVESPNIDDNNSVRLYARK